MTTPKSITELGVKVITTIGRQTNQIREIEAARTEWIHLAREQGCSWRLISVALGTSTQAAWDRYSGHERGSDIGVQAMLPEDVQEASHKPGFGDHRTVKEYQDCPACGGSES